MTVVELHPEELLDKERRGQLTDGDRDRLSAHLGHCVACRAERQMRADFAEELEGEVPDGLDARLPSLASILSVQQSPQPQEGAHHANQGAPLRSLPLMRMRKSARTAWLLVAAALVVVSAAAGAGVRGKTLLRLVSSVLTPEPAPPVAASVVATPPAKAAVARGPVSAPKQVSSPESPLADVPPLPAPSPAPESGPELARPGGLGVSPKGPGPQDAAALFDAERSARLRGDYARVIELHRELASRYPQSHEALVSRATVGQLLLDRGDPASALASFDGYLDASAGRGELAEVALVGRATALDRLGRSEEARRAWRALLVAFPDTPYAKHAAARLAVNAAGGDPSLR